MRNIELTAEELQDCTAEALYDLFSVSDRATGTDLTVSEAIQLSYDAFEAPTLDDSDGVWADTVLANAPTAISFRNYSPTAEDMIFG